MTATDISFPAAYLCEGMVVDVFRNADSLTCCTPKALASGTYLGCQLIDSSGAVYSIVQMRRLHRITPWWNIMLLLVRVGITLKPTCVSMTADELKTMALQTINSDLDFWDAGGVADEILERINKATTVQSVIESLYTGQPEDHAD